MAESLKNINPNYKKKSYRKYDLDECLAGIKTDRQILSFLISKAESSRIEDIAFVQQFLSKSKVTHSARRIAISGAPGVGKSTFLNCFAKHLIDKNNKVAILPVDPSSMVSKGSILGDKTRMDDLIGKELAYVKPMASALALGGVAPASMVSQLLCERAGFDYIFLETVGVGQSEYEARHLVDCFILLLQPGGGDELQGIKRGIMEMADILLINKVDGDNVAAANRSLKEYASAARLMQKNNYGWKSSVGLYSGLSGEYNEKLQSLIEQYYSFLAEGSKIDLLRKDQQKRYFQNEADKAILQLVNRKESISSARKNLEEELLQNRIDPITALLKFRENCEDELD